MTDMVIQRIGDFRVVRIKWQEMSVKDLVLYLEGRGHFKISNLVHHLPDRLAGFSHRQYKCHPDFIAEDLMNKQRKTGEGLGPIQASL